MSLVGYDGLPVFHLLLVACSVLLCILNCPDVTQRAGEAIICSDKPRMERCTNLKKVSLTNCSELAMNFHLSSSPTRLNQLLVHGSFVLLHRWMTSNVDYAAEDECRMPYEFESIDLTLRS